MQYSFYSLQLYVLWNVPIAEETITDRYCSVSEYVEALKVMNHLDSDTIHAGQYLMIAYEKL